MGDITDKFKINLNQNLWGLVVALASLGFAEYLGLCALYWFGIFLSVVLSLSVVATTFAYTVNYWKEKLK